MPSPQQTQIDLSHVPLFAGVEARAVATDAQEWLHFYRDGESVCVQGAPADCMIVILHGEVAILSEDSFLVTRRAPEVLGEQGFLNPDSCRTANAVARGTVKVLRIPQAEVNRLLAASPRFTMNLLKIVSAKLAEATSERGFRYRNEHRLMAAFNSHLAPEITSQLLARGDDYGRPRLINGVVLFADVRGFTKTSLGLSPTELADQLGDYLDEMVKILHAHHAYVDKFIGDAVMGVWGFPFESEHQISEAFACAKEMVFCAGEKTIGDKPVRIGIGLSAGSIFCGNVGSDLKRQFTVLGSVVNLAARCEAACKDLNSSIVISEDAYAQLTTIEAAELTVHQGVSLRGIGDVCLYTISNEGPQSNQRQ
jgi:class 3 adenylate cyclase